MDTQFAFFNSLQPKERDTFHHYEFARTKAEEQAAQQKGNELLKNSPYGDKSVAAKLFVEALKKRSKDVPNLVIPLLGDKVATSWTSGAMESDAERSIEASAAMPLGGRIKVDPWSNQLQMFKSRPEAAAREAARMPFQITPFFFYLARYGDNSPAQPPAGVAAKLDDNAKH
jgi:hypothetical protein